MLEDKLLKKLIKLQELAFGESTPNLGFLKEIKEELFQIKTKDREKLSDFGENLSNQLFKYRTSIPGLDLDKYFDKP